MKLFENKVRISDTIKHLKLVKIYQEIVIIS